tara:strand:+ start:142 stop:1515 length:1374 start_codon:yes stop_codon:yes gene_type:complete
MNIFCLEKTMVSSIKKFPLDLDRKWQIRPGLSNVADGATVEMSHWINGLQVGQEFNLIQDRPMGSVFDDIPKKDCIFFIDIHRISYLYAVSNNEGQGRFQRIIQHLIILINDPSNKTLFYTSHSVFQFSDFPFSKFITDNLLESAYRVQPENRHQATVAFLVGFSVDENNLKNKLDTHDNISMFPGYIKEALSIFKGGQRIGILPESHTELINTQPTKRFSVFSRRIDDGRQRLFFDLVRKDIIDNCHYSFGTSHPDFFEDPAWTKTVERLKEDATIFTKPKKKSNIFFLEEEEGDDSETIKVCNWLEGAPYTLGDYYNPHDLAVYQKLAESHINIVIETILWSSEIVLTEKIGKAIALKKPFILVAQPFALDFFHRCGFRSFHPIIDETYDAILNLEDRLEKLIKIIERFNNMPEQEFTETMEKIKEITEYNYQILESWTVGLHINPWFKNLGIFE